MAQKERILVVDDEPSIRKYLQTLLEVDGFEVEALSSGKNAVEKIGAGDRPDFIILDVLMPEQNGIDTLDYLTKPFEKTELDAAMLKCRQKKQLHGENQALRVGLLFLAAFEHGRVELGLFKWLGEIVERTNADDFDDGADFVRTGEH